MVHLSAYSLTELHQQNDKKPNKRADNCIVRQIKHTIDKTVIFHIGCHESWSSSMGHIVSVKFLVDLKKYQTEKPLNVDVKVKCTCPAFSFWGSDFVATQLGYGLDTDENREPLIRDPQNKNLICKHIAKTRLQLRNYTFKKLLNNKNAVPLTAMSDVLKKYIDPSILNESNLVEELSKKGVTLDDR